MHELPPPLLFPVLECIDVEVDGAVEGGEEVAGGGDVGQPVWPGWLNSLTTQDYKKECHTYNLQHHLLLGTVPRY